VANIKHCADIIFKWEGGFVNDLIDKGGATNMGVTLPTWHAVGYDKDGDGDIDIDDIRMLTKDDATIVLKKYYWDRWHADEIINQSIANILVDWVWCSGKWGIIIPQRILKVTDDGIVGKDTLSAVNTAHHLGLFSYIMQERGNFIMNIVRRDPSQRKYLNGWMNRLNDFKFEKP